jgi:hypothetical protein
MNCILTITIRKQNRKHGSGINETGFIRQKPQRDWFYKTKTSAREKDKVKPQ